MSEMSSVVMSYGGEALGVLRGVIRGMMGRWGTGPILVAAITIASALYSLYRTTPLRPRRGGGVRGGVRQRGTNARRPTGLTGVNRVTIGVELGRGLISSSGVAIHPENLAALRKFATLFELYVIVRVHGTDSDDCENRVSGAFAKAGVSGFDARKLLFCDTTEGRVSMVREIDPDLHIDEVESVVANLQRFIRHVACVSAAAPENPPPGAASSSSRKKAILRYNSFSQFF